jgi:ABC-type sugar transport system permease subunit
MSSTAKPELATGGPLTGPAGPAPGRPAGAVATPRLSRSARLRRWRGYVWVVPALAFYGAFVIYPALRTLGYSFVDWNGISEATWVGLANYRELFGDPELRGAIWHALILVVFFSWLPILTGLLMVGLLARRRTRGMTWYRTVFFLPQVLPMVAVGITWRWMYGDSGTVNQILRWVGLDSVTRAWLGDFDFALPAVGVIGTWAMTGLCMMLFLAGVQKVDPSLYEAARLDGA